jgi:hypothetical protein
MAKVEKRAGRDIKLYVKVVGQGLGSHSDPTLKGSCWVGIAELPWLSPPLFLHINRDQQPSCPQIFARSFNKGFKP